MEKISLFDVSALVYTGNCYDNIASLRASENFHGIPLAGLRYAIKYIFSNKIIDSIPIAVFDSKTDKKDYYSGYKGNREFNNSVFTQLEILKYLLPKLDVYTLIEDNYEADDLIYSMVYANESNMDKIYVYADDSDLAGTIISEKVTKIGTSSKTPIIQVNNYSSTVRKGKLIYYNTVLPYYLFKGKESNNVCSMKNGTKLYEQFIQWFNTSGIPKSQGSHKLTIVRYLQYCLSNNILPKDVIQTIINRINVVYPRIIDNPNDKLEKDFNRSVAEEYLSILGLREVCAILGVQYKDPTTIEKSKFVRWVEVYNSGAIHVKEDVPADKSFWFNCNNNEDNQSVGGF